MRTANTTGTTEEGLDLQNVDLRDNLWTNTLELNGIPQFDDDRNGYVDDFYGLGSTHDRDQHGTRIAGIIGATYGNGRGVKGVAVDVRIMTLSNPPSKASAIRYAIQNQAKIVNFSVVGFPSEFDSNLAAAIEEARQSNVLIVAAAGNAATDIDQQPAYPACYPHDNVITVMAIQPNEDVWHLSNYGAVAVDLAAPGSAIRHVPGYGTGSGTSQLAAFVAGAAALIWSQPESRQSTELSTKKGLNVSQRRVASGMTQT